jgi:acyl-CoA synthetase (AMP-forming)/AMP-acid ligase II
MQELVYARLLFGALDRYPATVAFVDDESGEQDTLAAHVERSVRFAAALRDELGLRRGDRFAVLAGNSRHYVNLWHAGLIGGSVITPVNTRLAPKEIAFILADAGCRAAVCDATFAPLVEEHRAALPALEHVILLGPGDVAHDCTYDELVAAGDDRLPEEPAEDDPATLMYTGGTTGSPKGAVLTQRGQALSVYRMGFMLDCFEKQEIYLQATPMFHGGGAMGTLTIPVSGGTTVVQERFEPGAFMHAAERHQVTITGLIPTMVERILHHESFAPERLASLHRLAYGASPMPVGLLHELQELLPAVDLVQAYGLTETSTVVTFLTPDDHRRGGDVLLSAGRALPGIRVSVQDDAGLPLPPGDTGEVCIRSGGVMVGYLNRDDETEASFRDGWFRTGDVGRLDQEGYLYLVDRTKDMIVTGGENVYSSEVESVISTHPAVAQVAVIGIPSERWGEEVHAVVVCRDGMTTTEADVIAWARQSLAGFKLPKSVELRSEPLPLSGAMKVVKRELRAAYRSPATVGAREGEIHGT